MHMLYMYLRSSPSDEEECSSCELAGKCIGCNLGATGRCWNLKDIYMINQNHNSEELMCTNYKNTIRKNIEKQEHA